MFEILEHLPYMNEPYISNSFIPKFCLLFSKSLEPDQAQYRHDLVPNSLKIKSEKKN